MAAANLQADLLKDVSRSFYLTLRVLPRRIRRPIGIAYLLARTTDTIADTELVPVEDRLAALDLFRNRVAGLAETSLDLARFAVQPSGPAAAGGARRPMDAEFDLVRRVPETVRALEDLAPADQQSVREVLATITSGQALDLRRFAGASVHRLVALASDAELDDYTYRVAGCVGEFWTRVCRQHLFPSAPVDVPFLLRAGVRFGQGLQMVNILRDLPQDLRLGRCYLPAQRLAEHDLAPRQLLDPTAITAFRGLYGEYLTQAEGLLADGWAYTDALPRSQARVRFACALPVLIGVRTLRLLRAGNVLDASRRLKISRREVRRLMLALVWCYPRPRAWERLFSRAQK